MYSYDRCVRVGPDGPDMSSGVSSSIEQVTSLQQYMSAPIRVAGSESVARGSAQHWPERWPARELASIENGRLVRTQKLKVYFVRRNKTIGMRKNPAAGVKCCE